MVSKMDLSAVNKPSNNVLHNFAADRDCENRILSQMINSFKCIKCTFRASRFLNCLIVIIVLIIGAIKF